MSKTEEDKELGLKIPGSGLLILFFVKFIETLCEILFNKPFSEITSKITTGKPVLDIAILVILAVVTAWIFFKIDWLRIIHRIWRGVELGFKGLYFSFKAKSFLSLAESWFSILRNPLDKKNKKLLEIYLDTYIKRESLNVKDGHYIYTNFIGYADIVKALVNKANDLIKKDRSKEVVCLTTLVLNPYKWFNFNDGGKGYSINDDWEDYKDFIVKIKNTVKILRYLIGYVETPENEAIIKNYGLSLRSEKNIKSELASLICSEQTSLKPVKLTNEQFQKLISLSTLPSVCKDFIETNYKSRKTKEYPDSAYFIFPNNTDWEPYKSIIQTELHVRCISLEAVLKGYYQHDGNFHQFYFDNDCLFYYFIDKDNEVPEDFFVIGIKEKKTPIGNTDWLFGIGADVDQELDKAKLYFFHSDQTIPAVNSAVKFNAVSRLINSRLLTLVKS